MFHKQTGDYERTKDFIIIIACHMISDLIIFHIYHWQLLTFTYIFCFYENNANDILTNDKMLVQELSQIIPHCYLYIFHFLCFLGNMNTQRRQHQASIRLQIIPKRDRMFGLTALRS